MKENIVIGIDTGTNTGFAVWSIDRQCFLGVHSMKIHKALEKVLIFKNSDTYNLVCVRVEDARKRGINPKDKSANRKLQGVGSVKRDSAIWEHFLVDYNIPYEMVSPLQNMTKVSRNVFKMMSGLDIASEHGRDAACLVLGAKKYTKHE